MKLKWVSLAIVLTTFGLPAWSWCQTQPADVRVMQWNIRRGIGANNPNTSQQDEIAKIVNYTRPDVWMINELGGNSSGWNRTSNEAALDNFVRQNLTIFGANPVLGQDFFMYVGTTSDRFIGNAIISRFRLDNTVTFSDSLRGIVSGQIVLDNGLRMQLYTQHMVAFDTDSDAMLRQGQAESAARAMNTFRSANPTIGYLWGGDLNASEDSFQNDNWANGDIGGTLPNGRIYRPVSTVRDANLNDPIPVSANGDKDTLNSASPNVRFDYLMHSSTSGLTYRGGEVFNTAAYPFGSIPLNSFDSQLASDHLPVIGNYSVVPEPATLAVFGLGLAALLRRRAKR